MVAKGHPSYQPWVFYAKDTLSIRVHLPWVGREGQGVLGKASKISPGLCDERCLWSSADGPAQLAGLLPWHLQHL